MTTILQSMTMVGGRIVTRVFHFYDSSFLFMLGDRLADISYYL